MSVPSCGAPRRPLALPFGQTAWRSVSAEVEASRNLGQRVCAFAGVQYKDAASLEAALRTLQHCERERLTLLIQLREDVY